MNEPTNAQPPAQPLLTIAIPTYNRSRYLRELLSVLEDQIAGESRIEFLVSDNASTDDTPSVIAEFQERGLKMRYLRNSKNIGADGNFLQCFELAGGKYFWLFGDDDILLPGSLSLLINKLASNTYDLVYINSFPLHELSSFSEARGLSHVLDTSDARIFASNVHIYLTFITGNIINKESALRGLESPVADLQNTNLLQLGWTCAALNQFRRGLIVMDKLIGARVDNTGGYKLLEVFGPSLQSVTKDRINDGQLRAIISNGAIQRFWPGMLMSYKLSAESFSQEAAPHVVLGSVFHCNWRYWLFTAPIARLPLRLGQLWFFAVRLINRLDRALGYPLLRVGSAKLTGA